MTNRTSVVVKLNGQMLRVTVTDVTATERSKEYQRQVRADKPKFLPRLRRREPVPGIWNEVIFGGEICADVLDADRTKCFKLYAPPHNWIVRDGEYRWRGKDSDMFVDAVDPQAVFDRLMLDVGDGEVHMLEEDQHYLETGELPPTESDEYRLAAPSAT
jgi:hypothetical protein